MRQSLLTSLSLAALLGLAGAARAAPVCQPEKLAQKYPELAGVTVKIGADPSTPPYAMVSPDDPNVITGSDMELAAAALDCVGLKHEIKPGAWPGLFPSIVSGQNDVMFYIYYTPKRVASADFVVYMKAASGAIVHAGNPKNIKSADDLCGTIVSAGLGTVEAKQMTTMSDACVAKGSKPIEVMTSADVPSGFRLVGSGRADAMISDLPLVDMMAKRNPETYAIAYSVVTTYEIGAAVKKGSPLGPALAEGLATIQAQGVQDKIFEKYGIDKELIVPAELKTK